MRTSLHTSLALFAMIATPCFAQIPNSGFEAWSSVGLYEDPDGWVTVNDVTWSGGQVLSCSEGTPGVEGASFAKITTHTVAGFGTVPGVIFAGSILHPGFACGQRPTSLDGQWQYYMQSGDAGTIIVDLTRWNPDITSAEPIGAAQWYFSGVFPVWGPFSIPITYVSDLDPDTAHIQIFSSLGNAVDGSAIWVDALSFSGATGVPESSVRPEMQLQPAFAIDRITITTDLGMEEVAILDMSGRQLEVHPYHGNAVPVEVAHLPAGTYVARVRFTDGRSAVRTFVKG